MLNKLEDAMLLEDTKLLDEMVELDDIELERVSGGILGTSTVLQFVSAAGPFAEAAGPSAILEFRVATTLLGALAAA